MSNINPQITIRDIPVSHAKIEDHIHNRIHKLEHFSSHIVFCDIVLESPQAHKKHGKLYNINIKCGVPKETLIVNHHDEEDITIAINTSFDRLEQQLKNYHEKRRSN